MNVSEKVARLFVWLRASYPNATYSQAAPSIWDSELKPYTEAELLAAGRRCLQTKQTSAPTLGDIIQAAQHERSERNRAAGWAGTDQMIAALPPVEEDVPKLFDLYQKRCADTDRANGIEPPPPKEDMTRDDYYSPFFKCTRGELVARIAKLRDGIS